MQKLNFQLYNFRFKNKENKTQSKKYGKTDIDPTIYIG